MTQARYKTKAATARQRAVAHTILIVDDNGSARDELVRVVQEGGYRTLTASSVPIAMELLAQAQPDLLITEVRVDTYNGLHLVAMAPKPIPAIVVTRYSDRVIEADARRLGAEYLSAPVSPDILRMAITRTLANAAERGVFLPARQEPRRKVVTPVAVTVDNVPARLLDISATGARLELASVPPHGFAASLTVRFPDAGLELQVDVAWKRRKDERIWLCGVEVPETARTDWRQVIELAGV